MNLDWMSQYTATLAQTGTEIGIRIIGAIALWVIGRVVITLVLAGIGRRMVASNIDVTLTRYVDNAARVVFNLILVLAMLSVFGVETTSFAGLLAAAGVAIGMAWSGLLANFAAGAFMVVLRPFKVGDLVEAAGHLGEVREIGLFVTAMDTPDNVRTMIGNNAIFSATIKNFSTNPHRRVDLVAQLAHGVDPARAVQILKDELARVPNVLGTPAPDVEILTFTLAGPVLAVRPYCANAHYWQVYFDTNRLIARAFGEAGFPVPENHLHITQS
jgi:small conductance mechanosensitive channel